MNERRNWSYYKINTAGISRRGGRVFFYKAFSINDIFKQGFKRTQIKKINYASGKVNDLTGGYKNKSKKKSKKQVSHVPILTGAKVNPDCKYLKTVNVGRILHTCVSPEIAKKSLTIKSENRILKKCCGEFVE